jgi:hypothetical protein
MTRLEVLWESLVERAIRGDKAAIHELILLVQKRPARASAPSNVVDSAEVHRKLDEMAMRYKERRVRAGLPPEEVLPDGF